MFADREFALAAEAYAEASRLRSAESVRGGTPPQHGLSPDKMALITSGCARHGLSSDKMALITSGCVPFSCLSVER